MVETESSSSASSGHTKVVAVAPVATAAGAAAAGPRLEYDTKSPAISRRQVNFLLLLIAINTVLFAAFICLPAASPVLRQLWDDHVKRREAEEQRQADERAAATTRAQLQACKDYAVAPTVVVYAEAPAEVAKVLAAFGQAQTFDGRLSNGGGGFLGASNAGGPFGNDAGLAASLAEAGWRAPAARGLPDVLRAMGGEFLHIMHGENCVFLHGMRTPAGESRLVWVSVDATPLVTAEPGSTDAEPREAVAVRRSLVARVIEDKLEHVETCLTIDPASTPRGTLIRRAEQKATLAQRGHWRVFAGQVDPANASHLMIAYEIDGKAGVIDGWLRDGDRLMMEPRVGELVNWNDRREYVWDMKGGAAATRPAK